MIKVDWEKFKAKFSENPQYNFEWLCYLLFCKEFNKPYGIFRYKNQSAIETNPILNGDNEIGFQAKFYQDTLSKHSPELINCLIKANRDYPNIAILRFYTNQEWAQAYTKSSSKVQAKKPQGLIDIENKAKELGIELQWMTLSYFESEFVTKQCEDIIKHFFIEEQSIINFITHLEDHTQAILNQIHNTLSYDNKHFTIQRNDILDRLENNESNISIITGYGGVGKTVEIKKLYESLKNTCPFYVCKATEFELDRLSDFSPLGSLKEFAECYGDSDKKVFVIDSAEKLLELNNEEPFKEFLMIMIKNNWHIIFTTRDHYFNDLNFLCLDIYKISPYKIYIKELTSEELKFYSKKYSFKLPSDDKLINLLRTPLYLNEYLNLVKDDTEFDYLGFKDNIWRKKVVKGSTQREPAFISLAVNRANHGNFFIKPEKENSKVLEELRKDGLLGYEHTRLFITHDIYEEWALEKYIGTEYNNRLNALEFFNSINQSLPIRRSFRHWVSERILLNDNNIIEFLEELIDNDDIPSFWKDEVIVSILLSDYSSTFFDNFGEYLLKDDNNLLKRICFIVRIACKEIDEKLINLLGGDNKKILSYEFIFTQPRGDGWSALIKFIYDHLDIIGIENIDFTIPLLNEWNSKNKQGQTTKYASLIAIRYYKWTQAKGGTYSDRSLTSPLLKIITSGVYEIQSEFKKIINDIATHKFTEHGNPYLSLSKQILTQFDGLIVANTLPNETLSLANTFWIKDYSNEYESFGMRENVKKYGLTDDHDLKYYPESALQTPIYVLLKSDPIATIEFILNINNKIMDNLLINTDKQSFEKIIVYSQDVEIEQYINNSLWGAYRDSGNAPSLFCCILMALEKYLLDIGETSDSLILEKWLMKLLLGSKSAAISAVVTSIVNAFPEKTFNVASILFKTRAFIEYDFRRKTFDTIHKSQIISLNSMYSTSALNEIHQKERIESCDLKHRLKSLEDTCLYYQCFRDETVSEEDSAARQTIVWDILDHHYQDLTKTNAATDPDGVKLWKLSLARMDRRKMEAEVKNIDGNVAVQFNPILDSDLKEFTEESQAHYSEQNKYLELKLWAEQSFNNSNVKQYEKYNNEPQLALIEAKQILEILKKTNPDGDFYLLNSTTPVYVCAKLIKLHHSDLDIKDLVFCKNIIFNSIVEFINLDYNYQVGDGIEACFDVISELLLIDPELMSELKYILLLALFNESSTGMAHGSVNTYAVSSIYKLWESHFQDAESLFLAYLKLKPIYTALINKIREDSYKKNNYNVDYGQLLKRFTDDNEEIIDKFISNKLRITNIKIINELDLSSKITALQLIPHIDYTLGKDIFQNIIKSNIFSLLSEDRENKIDHISKHDFFEVYAHYVLTRPKNDIEQLIDPFVQHFNSSESTAELINAFVLVQDKLAAYDNFWFIWGMIEANVIKLAKSKYCSYATNKIIKAYLFVQPWKESATSWHTFKPTNKRFFGQMSIELATCPSTLYSISKLLNDIGSSYLDNGTAWISNIIISNPDLMGDSLDQDTIYYMKNYIKRYMYINRQQVKQSKQLKDRVLIILDHLIAKGEVTGYLLRESII